MDVETLFSGQEKRHRAELTEKWKKLKDRVTSMLSQGLDGSHSQTFMGHTYPALLFKVYSILPWSDISALLDDCLTPFFLAKLVVVQRGMASWVQRSTCMTHRAGLMGLAMSWFYKKLWEIAHVTGLVRTCPFFCVNIVDRAEELIIV